METKKLIKDIEQAIERVVNGSTSNYVKFTDDNDINWTVRVSDHTANPKRCDNYTISLVVDVDNSSRKYFKNFRNIANVHYLDSDGDFTEQFRDVEEMLDWYLY